jgi:ATP-dependent DNA helicase RecG
MKHQIPEQESLTVEFKSDRKGLPDRDLIEAIVCLANTDGGKIFLGVEDDGTPTGLNPQHQNLTGLAAMVASRTVPSISVRVEAIQIDAMIVARIEVPRSLRPVSTSEGVLQRRRMRADGKPECAPLYPHEIIQRDSSLGILDYSALPVRDSSRDDFDPLERERLRQMIARYGGDQSLNGLDDLELEGALGFMRREAGELLPTVAGLLVLGRERVLREMLPAHEVAFQVLDGTQVKTNDFYRFPMLRVFERILDQFSNRMEEDEIQEGLFRVPVPNYDLRAFREAFVNALIHRDYTCLGATHIRMENEGIIVSNPGGFVEGVNLQNLLVVEPKPRNPLLADAIKRIGLAERTGRGVDLIYQGMLRYGRPEPDYSRSNHTTVVVQLSSAMPDVAFLRMIIAAEERAGTTLPLDSLIVLARLRGERRLSAGDLAAAIQKGEPAARAVLERLTETGLVEAHGIKKGRSYTLSAKVYRSLGRSADYIRQAGFDSIQQEEMIIRFVGQNGRITRVEAAELCRISPYQATRLLGKLLDEGRLERHGQTRGTYYTLRNEKNERAR